MDTLKLSAVDYLFTGAGSQPITFAFYYPSSLDVKVLQDGLYRTLEYFPFLSSQLEQFADNEYQFFVTEAGLTFEVDESNVDFTETDSIDRYIPPVITKVNHPLTKIKLTHTPRGSVLGISISHALVDGFSYFHFLSSWARICRGEKILPPSHQRETILKFSTPDIGEITPQLLLSNCGLFYGNKRPSLKSTDLHQEKIFLSTEIIKTTLQKINEEQQVSFTTNDMITALLWKKYLPLWIEENDNPETFVTCPVDFRRLIGNFPPNYFGCALCFATASIGLQNLVEASLGELAVGIKNAVNRVRDNYIFNSLHTLQKFRQQQGLEAMEKIHLRHPQTGLIVTNLTRMPLSDLDFGTGKMESFLTYAEVSASAAILPAKEGVEICFTHPKKLKK